MSEKTGGIYRKIANVLGAIEEIPKTGKNPHFGYAFHEEQVIVEHLRPMLAKVGVVLSVEQGERHTEETAKGGKVVVAPTTVTFIDVEDGSHMKARVWGEGQDTQDKGSHKALVGAFKYALMKTFLISSGKDDPEHDRGAPQKRSQPVNKSTGEVVDFPCPSCGGPMWDNRDDEKAARNGGKRPDWKCKDKGCDNAIWGHHPEELPEVVEGLLEDAATVGAVDVDKAADIEKLIENGELDRLRLAKDWLETQIQKKQADGSYDPAEDESAPEPQGV